MLCKPPTSLLVDCATLDAAGCSAAGGIGAAAGGADLPKPLAPPAELFFLAKSDVTERPFRVGLTELCDVDEENARQHVGRTAHARARPAASLRYPVMVERFLQSRMNDAVLC